MATLTNKLKLYCNQNNIEPDFTKDIVVQDDSNGKGPYLKTWNIKNLAKPNDAQLAALENDANKYEKNQQVIAKRKKLYGSPERMIEFITENGLDKWQAEVKKIKSKHKKED